MLPVLDYEASLPCQLSMAHVHKYINIVYGNMYSIDIHSIVTLRSSIKTHY